MAAYYNEFDPYAAQWLRNCIRDGLIAPGDVDERSIEDVCPDDLRPYTQCHFFAGVGAWSYALRRAGWDDARPIWTASCPCQPFSSAGKGDGFDDERHLWPAFYHLVTQCEPSAICGEQVESKDGMAWLDLVSADLEAMGYAVWTPVIPIAGVGGPNERHRTWWVGLADAAGEGRHGGDGGGVRLAGAAPDQGRHGYAFGDYGAVGGVADAPGGGLAGVGRALGAGDVRHAGGGGEVRGLVDDGGRPGPTNGFWRDADWLFCTDGKWRPVEPGTRPLAHGLPRGVGEGSAGLRRLCGIAGVDFAAALGNARKYRVGTLRGYGNMISPEVAAEFIRAWIGVAP